MKKDLEMAEQQIIGFSYGSSGFSIVALAESMGLTKKEWLEIREWARGYLTGCQIEEMDGHYNIK